MEHNGVSIFGLLGIAFIVLKLTGFITWSWWYVLMPLYVMPAILIAGAIIAFIIMLFNK